MNLGSLFDGSGGFPLAASLCGITPVWASEVEPYPIAVTKNRFPKMKHLGDISKINGGEIEPVDIITFGSPCQDLSVAGKRAGLKHTENGDDETTRSGLFMEAVRIIKEMREATSGIYPRYALWENVPGAFSSNKGEDFRIVLEELIKIVEPSAVMPAVPKAGWAYADSYVGDGWSIAYRVFDAQYWGVPQRRRRIYLVADFRGECAEKILFEREGLRGYPAESGTPWQRTAADAEGSLGADDRAGAIGIAYGWPLGFRPENVRVYEETATTLCNGTRPGFTTGVIQPVVNKCILDDQGGQQVNVRTDGKSPTLRAEMHGNVPAVIEPAPVYCLQGNGIDRADTAGCNGKGVREDVCYTPNTIDRPAVCYAETYQRTVGPLMANSHPGSYSGQDAYTDMFVVGKTFACSSKQQSLAVLENLGNTLGAKGPSGVAYAGHVASFYPQMKAESQCFREDGVANTIVNGTNPGYQNGVVQSVAYGVDCRNATEYPEMTGALQSRASNNANSNNVVRVRYIVPDAIIHPTHDEIHEFITDNNADAPHQQDLLQAPESVARTIACGTHAAGSHLTKTVINLGMRYIVRRLTPTECARLQGFPDTWGHIDPKEDLTDEEYAFWTEVRTTYDVINGREPKTYGRKQMLTWYNKLWTDSAEYKMWGNGIALPCALYVMRGIAEICRGVS